MKTKLVLWGANAQDERILITMELNMEEDSVVVRTYDQEAVTDEVYQNMMDLWREDKPVEGMPEPQTTTNRELNLTESLLPDEIKVERGDLVQRAQTEWHYVVLSTRLSQSYASELEELEDRIDRTEKFNTDIWENLKSFWSKVQSQLRDRTLLREHGDELRRRTNQAFAKMKELRSKR